MVRLVLCLLLGWVLALPGADLEGDPLAGFEGYEAAFPEEVDGPRAPDPARPETYGLVLVVDGAKGDAWRRQMDRGKLPHTRRIFSDQGLWVDHCTSTFPTITGAGMPAVLTGNLPARTKIPSLYFFDRVRREYPVLYVPLEALTWNRWLSPEVKTLWEHFPGKDDTISMGPALDRGADRRSSIAWNLGYKALEVRTRLEMAKLSLKRFFTGGPPARLTVLYNGWFDHMEHGHGAEGPAIEDHYQAVDELIGEAVRTFEAVMRRREKKIGRPVARFVVLVSDHGHQEIRQVHSIDDWIRKEKGARVLDKVWTKVFGQKLKGRVPKKLDDREVVLAAGEGHALLYFPTPEVDPGRGVVSRLDWQAAPSLRSLRDYPFRDRRMDVVGELLATPATHFVVGKDRETGLVHIYGKAGEATIERQGDSPTRAEYRYTVVAGVDPLGYVGDPAVSPLVDGGFHHADLWQQATLETEAPDGVVQLHQAFEVGVRAPDLYLSAAPYVSIGDLVDGEKSKSKHGGLTRDEAWATLAFHGTGIAPGRLATARNIDMVPTLLDLMGVPFDPAEKDGRVLAVRGGMTR